MREFKTTNGYELSLSSVFSGLTMSNPLRAKQSRGYHNILGHRYIEALWGYFKNPMEAIVEERVAIIEPNIVSDNGGLKLFPVSGSDTSVFKVVTDSEVSALRELFEVLGGRLPKEAMQSAV